MCGKLNLPMFLFNVGLFTLMNMDSLIFLAKFCPSLLYGSCYDWWGGLCGCCVDEWVRSPLGVLCIFHQENSTHCGRHHSIIRNYMSQKHILSFQGQFYEQVQGAAMGSPVSSIVVNLYMEYFEYCHPPPRFWCRFVDDTFVILKEIHKQDFLQHINNVDPAIKFTVEDNKEDGAIPFLDTIVKSETDGKLSITVYRKPTHTHQYLQWDSHSSPLSQVQCYPYPFP